MVVRLNLTAKSWYVIDIHKLNSPSQWSQVNNMLQNNKWGTCMWSYRAAAPRQLIQKFTFFAGALCIGVLAALTECPQSTEWGGCFVFTVFPCVCTQSNNQITLRAFMWRTFHQISARVHADRANASQHVRLHGHADEHVLEYIHAIIPSDTLTSTWQ